MSSFFQELLRLRKLSTEPLVYQSVSMPLGMGDALPNAYGGCAIALGIQAAFHSLPGASIEENASWAIYSANGG
jgi:hypothetical protein